jgi:hypothetical protein
MSELQTDDASATNDLINPTAAQTDLGTVENGPELATGGNEDSDTTNQDADNGVNKAINKAHHLRHKAERATLVEKQRADELQAKFDAIEANKPAPTVSDMPDRFDMSDEEFSVALQKRDTQRQELADHNAAQKARQTASQAANDKALEDANAKITDAGNNFRKKADQLGISKEIQDSSAQTVMSYGVSNDLLVHICGYDESPLIMQYLASNPAELHELAGMGLAQAAIHVDGAIKVKAAALRPKTSNAPDPVVPLSGNGVDPNASKHPAFKGGTYS